MRILSLTTSSSGCERNWSTLEGVHIEKRNRPEATKFNDLDFVRFNANLIRKNKKRKEKGIEVLLVNDASEAQDWIVESAVDEVDPRLHWETTSEAVDGDECLTNRKSSRLRELLEDEFESESEEEVDDEVEYESDGANREEEDQSKYQ